jgi:hypothetical protein
MAAIVCTAAARPAGYLQAGPCGCRDIHLLGSACWRHLQFHAIASHANGWIVRIIVTDDLRSKADCAVVAFAASLCANSGAVATTAAEKRGRGKEVPLRKHGSVHVAVVVFSCLWRFVESAAPGNATDFQHCSRNGNRRQDLAERPYKSYPAVAATQATLKLVSSEANAALLS